MEYGKIGILSMFKQVGKNKKIDRTKARIL